MIKFNPESINFYFSGTELPTQNIKCLLYLTDILNNPRHTVSISYNQSQKDWLRIYNDLETDITDKSQFGYPARIFVKHKHDVVIPDGNYSALVMVDFTGESSEIHGVPYYDYGSFYVYLTVKAGISGFSVVPGSSTFHVVKNVTANPIQNLVFTTPTAFTITGSDKFFANGHPLPYSVPENSVVELSTNQAAKQLPNGVYDYILQFQGIGSNYGNFPAKIVVTNTDKLEVFPANFEFNGIKGITEPEWQNIYVYDPIGDAVIEIPDFIRHEFISNDNGFKIYSIKPKESNALTPGNHLGEITFTSGNNIVKSSVNYNLQGLYNSDYERAYHFTRDAEKLVMVKAVQDKTTFLRLSLDLKFYDFKGKETKIDDRILDFFFFDSRVEFDAGQLIHEMFTYYNESPNERFNEINQSTGIVPQYQFASIYFEVSEIDFDTLEVKNSYVIPTQYYVKGRRPNFWTDNILLTQREGQFTRITLNSLISFNFIKYNGGELILRKNGKLIQLPNTSEDDEIPQGSDVRMFGGIINVSDIEDLNENDVLELSFNNQKQIYIVEEEGINSINVFYKNEWGILSSYELTGEFIVDSEYDRVTTSSFDSWVENTRTLSTDKVQKIKINSGFIPLENVKILNEILSSPKVFFVINNSTYEARPITTKLNNQTSKNNLVDRQLEFELKNKIDDTFYSF